MVHSPFGYRAAGPARQPPAGRQHRPVGECAAGGGVHRRRGASPARRARLLAQTSGFRLARRVRFPAQRRGPAGAGDRRHRLPLRRHLRRDRLQAAARRDFGVDAAVLELLARPFPGGAGAGRP